MPRPLTDRGKGSYWTVNDNVDPRTGVHRIRKKKPKSGSKRGIQSQDQDGEQPQDQAQAGMDEDVDYHPGAGVDPAAAANAAAAAAVAANVYQDPNFVPPPVMAADGSGPSRQAQAFPPPYGT